MSLESEAGQHQTHIVTPIPLPYVAPSTTVLQSMIRKELKDENASLPGIPLLENLDDSVDGAQVPTADAQQASKNGDPEPPRITRIGNPIELALLSPNAAKQDNTFVPPSANCRCKADCIQWSCIYEYTKNVSLNAWGY